MRHYTIVLLVIVSLITVAAPTTFAQDKPQIVASFSILADIAANVAGDAADVSSLMPVNADPHAFAPAPRDVARLADADAVLVVGANFEESLIETIENAGAGVNIVEVSSCIDILPFGDTPETEDHGMHDDNHDDHPLHDACMAHHALLDGGEDTHDHAMHDDHDDHHAETLGPLFALTCGHDESGDGHNHGACDPHVWMDPHNVMLWTLMIRDTLSELDPANADTYAANAAATITSLEDAITNDWEPMLASIPEANRQLVTSHQTLGYLAEWADFDIVGLVLPSTSALAEPSAAEIAALIDTINDAGVTAIFAETTTSSDLVEQVADETGVTVVTLYSGSLSEDDGPASTYIDYMSTNISMIVSALSLESVQ